MDNEGFESNYTEQIEILSQAVIKNLKNTGQIILFNNFSAVV